MFAEVVGFVATTFCPVNVKLALADAVADPVEAHVNGLGAFLFDGVVGDAGGGAVIGLYGGGRLGVAEFFKASA
jgi:hypothetical protein